MLNAVRWIVLSLLAVSILVFSFTLGYVFRGDDGTASSVDTVDQPTVSGGEVEADFSNLNDILRLLEEKYVDPDLIDEETLYHAAITGMLQTFPDSGTFYVDPNTVATSIGPSGKFEGIGATIAAENGEIVIVAPIEDSPAERAGVRPGDVIVAVDGESTEGWTQEKAVLKIRGPQGTVVELTLRHTDGEEETIEIERDEIRVKSVATSPPGGVLRDGAGDEITDVGYIYIREFTEETTSEVVEAVRAAIDNGAKGLIIDVRNNPGGLLSVTADVVDEFLDDGKVILLERERGGKERQFRSHRGGVATDIPIVVVQNRFSASGAEVLSAALQDNDRATIVGEKSFGKGTVNISNGLDDGGQLYVAIAKWLTPDGQQIEGVGVRPDVRVEPTDADIDARRDVQLFKAIDILRGTDTMPASALTPETPTAVPTPAS